MSDYDKIIPPLDIQIEIMKRLPVKSLIQFTSVSKSWKSIIHSSRFIADYNSSHIQPNHLFVGYDHEKYVNLFNADDDDNSFLQRLTLPMFRLKSSLIGYAQGLFGFHCYNNNLSPRDDSVVVIWNPSIKKSVVIPVPESPYQTYFDFTVCNATDPTIFMFTQIPRLLQVDIFTLSTGSWTNFINTSRESLHFTRMRVVIDRFIHWIVSDWTPGSGYLDKLILSFDITSEQFTELCLPPSLACCCLRDLDLSKLGESLVVLEYIPHKEIGVWMMMMEPGVQNSFTKLFTLKVPYPSLQEPEVLGFTKNGHPIFQINFSPSKWKLLSYQPDLERFNDVEIAEPEYSCLAGSYMETLLLLDH